MNKALIPALALWALCGAQGYAQDVPVALLPVKTDASPTLPQPADTPLSAPKTRDAQQAIIDKIAPHAKAGAPAHQIGQISAGATASAQNNSAPPPWSGYQAAESLATNGNPQMALRQLEARLASAPDDRKAAYLKGLIMMQMGKGEDAERWFRMMQSNFPDMAQPYNALAVIYDSRDDLRAARDILETLLQQQPEQHNARVNLGNIYLKLARQQFEKALKDKPDNAMIRRKLKAIQESSAP